ncbi:MAG: hypothetical protein GY939_28720, partial [Actinomycetia bacterium]|nr:hypothetical protein [Actinomycetes bacterium]
ARVIGTIQQGLSRDPDDRYHDAEAFADTLTSAIETLISNPVEPRDIGGNGDLDAAAQPLSVPGKPEAGITPRVNQSAFQAQDEEEVEDPFGIEALLEPPTENRTTSTTGGTLSSRSTRSEAMNTDEQGRRSSARHPQASILDLEASARFVKAPAIPRATSASRPLAGSTRASGKDWSSGNLDHEASSSIALFDLDRAEEAIGDDNESSSSPTNDGLNSLTDDISVPVDEEADIWVSADQCQDPEDRSGYTEVPNEIAGNGNEITANEPKSKGELRADWLTPLPDSHVDLPADQPPPPAAADTKPFTEQSPPTDNGSANADEERKPWVIGADQLWQVPDAPTNPEAITMANEDEQTASERDQARAENVTDGSQQPVRSIWDLPDDLDVGDDSPKLGESANRPTLDPEAMTRSLLFPDDGDHVDENWDIETHVSDPINNQGPPPMIPATAAIPLPFEVTGNTGPRSITSDESVPFRTFERQRLTHRQHSRAGQIMENLQASWYNRRRSVGGVIAVLSFAGLAGIVAALVVQDFRQSAANRTTTTSTTAATSSSQGETAGPIAIKPTGVPPVLSEPASTHASQASSATPKRVTTTVRRNQTSTTTPSSATSGVTTATSSTTASQSSSTTTPSSSSTVSSTTTSTASTGSTTTDPQPVTSVDTTVTPDPEGPTLPLIQGARADKIRPTSAQIRFESSACVTATFSYGPTGGGRSIISGGSDCNDAHV